MLESDRMVSDNVEILLIQTVKGNGRANRRYVSLQKIVEESVLHKEQKPQAFRLSESLQTELSDYA